MQFLTIPSQRCLFPKMTASLSRMAITLLGNKENPDADRTREVLAKVQDRLMALLNFV